MPKICFALLLLAGLAWPADKVLPHRWVYVSRSLRSDRDVEDIRQIDTWVDLDLSAEDVYTKQSG